MEIFMNRHRTGGRGYMKKIIALTAGAVLLALLPAGCGSIHSTAIQLGLAESPYYHNGDTEWDHGGIEEYYFNQIPGGLNEIYRELYSRLSNREDEADLYAQVRMDEFQTAYTSVINDHPEFFWLGSNMEMSWSDRTGKVVAYKVTPIVGEAERDAMQRQIEEAADQCIAGIPGEAGDYEKIKYVYEYIINTTDYDSSSEDNQSIQSVLLNKRSVCAGYSRAFQYILHRMGLFCTYVSGTTTDGGDHAWNIVRIGDQYYNVDVTWGDPVFENSLRSSDQVRAMNYNYLCCTDAELDKTHISDAPVPLPACTDDSYNYYKLNGMYYETFDYDTIYNTLMNSVWNNADYCVMKFGSDEAYQQARTEIFDNGMLRDPTQYLMDTYGQSSWNYTYNTDDEFDLITIYWQ